MVTPPITLDAAELRLHAAARVVADVQHEGEREPTRAEDQELLDAIALYGAIARAERAAVQREGLANAADNDGRATHTAATAETTTRAGRAGGRNG
jgi:hypothetical protein